VSAALPLNSGLYRVHRVFYIAFFVVAIGILLFGLLTLFRGGEAARIGFAGLVPLAIGAAHWYAAKGARDGKTYGKVLSRIIGSLWLIGFPIGTVLGMYVWSQTGAIWKDSCATNSDSGGVPSS
jgi:multisubunit Na+/H+ antiporter MnhB subunit